MRIKYNSEMEIEAAGTGQAKAGPQTSHSALVDYQFRLLKVVL